MPAVRAVVMRVSSARVEVDGRVAGAIDGGLLVLVGVGTDDDETDADYLARKVTELRIFRDDEGAMNRALAETGGAILAVSQFTLYGDVRRGRRPSFVAAARPEAGLALYDHFVRTARSHGPRVETGVFGATMQVHSVNDGPVTILIDSRME